ncbi:MAG: hypothetical protein ACLU6Y_04280 [Ruminococcus sp.]
MKETGDIYRKQTGKGLRTESPISRTVINVMAAQRKAVREDQAPEVKFWIRCGILLPEERE